MDLGGFEPRGYSHRGYEAVRGDRVDSRRGARPGSAARSHVNWRSRVPGALPRRCASAEEAAVWVLADLGDRERYITNGLEVRILEPLAVAVRPLEDPGRCGRPPPEQR